MGLRAWAEIRKSPAKYSNVSDAILAVVLGAFGVLMLLLGFAGFVLGATAERAPAMRHATSY